MALNSSCRWLCRAHDKTHPMNDYSFIYYLLRHEIEKCVTKILSTHNSDAENSTVEWNAPTPRPRRQSPNVKTYIAALSLFLWREHWKFSAVNKNIPYSTWKFIIRISIRFRNLIRLWIRGLCDCEIAVIFHLSAFQLCVHRKLQAQPRPRLVLSGQRQ